MIWVYISILCCAFGSGGIPNLNASLCSYIFGREQYMNVMRFAQPIQQLIRLISLVMMAYFYDTFGSYDMRRGTCLRWRRWTSDSERGFAQCPQTSDGVQTGA